MQITIPVPTLEGTFALIKSIGDWLLNIYHNGPKWMAWVAAGVVVLIYFGFFSLPTFSAKDKALESQISVLSAKIDRLSTNIETLKADLAPAKKLKK